MLALVPMMLVDGAVFVAPACVGQISSDRPLEKALAALTGEGAEVEASRLLVAHAAKLVLETVHVVHRLRHHRLPWKLMLAVQIRDHAGSEQYALDVLDPLKSLCC